MSQKVKKGKDIAEKIEEKSEEAAQEVLEVVDTASEKVVEEVKSNHLAEKFKKLPLKKIGFAGLVGLAIVGTGASVYFYNHSQVNNDVLGTQQAQVEEAKEVVEMVGKLIELPGEEPNIATVSDVEKLKNQPFFAQAQNGDKVLIYQNTKKVYLYRPSTKKLVDVGTLNVDTSTQQAARQNTDLIASGEPTPTPEEEAEPVTVALFNGTSTTGLTRIGEASLGGLENIEVAARDNAQKRDYEKTVVINIGNADEKRLEEIANALDAVIGDLPDGETKPNTDILVILGSEFAQRNTQE